MFNANAIIWADFESASALDLKVVGALRYAVDTSTRAIVLAYAVGDAPAATWHADGAILAWDTAPNDLIQVGLRQNPRVAPSPLELVEVSDTMDQGQLDDRPAPASLGVELRQLLEGHLRVSFVVQRRGPALSR